MVVVVPEVVDEVLLLVVAVEEDVVVAPLEVVELLVLDAPGVVVLAAPPELVEVVVPAAPPELVEVVPADVVEFSSSDVVLEVVVSMLSSTSSALSKSPDVSSFGSWWRVECR